MSKFVVATLFAGLMTAQGAWAACIQDIDMQGHGIKNLTVMGADVEPTEAATAAYVNVVTGQRGDGLTLSYAVQTDVTWSEAMQYCNTLSSTAVDNQGQNIEETVYEDWRLPTLEEWSNACYMQGAKTTINIEQEPIYYMERQEHPERVWTPAGACGGTGPDATFWWINRHSSERLGGDYVPFELNSGLKDAIYKATPPEADGIVRNVKHGHPWVWNPSTVEAEVKQVDGDQVYSVRCVR